jgi:hypothetical protein
MILNIFKNTFKFLSCISLKYFIKNTKNVNEYHMLDNNII